MEQYFQETIGHQDTPSTENWKTISDQKTGLENPSSGFDCNICLDTVHDPVVTLCGHLYCWPCIYKWLQFETVSSTENPDHREQPQCPVCKAEVSHSTLVPLYGRGQTKPNSKGKVPHLGLVIPRRPSGPSCGIHSLVSPSNTPRSTQQLHHRSFYSPGSYPSPSSNGGTMVTNGVHPMVGMFGEMIYARVFGNPETNLFTNSYHMIGSNSPRVRRHVMQADKSLSRICFFLLCCLVLCLLLFWVWFNFFFFMIMSCHCIFVKLMGTTMFIYDIERGSWSSWFIW